jgi:hypothetical protein
MDNVQNCNGYINIPWSQTYRSKNVWESKVYHASNLIANVTIRRKVSYRQTSVSRQNSNIH